MFEAAAYDVPLGAVGSGRKVQAECMKIVSSLAIMAALVALGQGTGRAIAAEQEGVALAIVYDTSGSMKDPVRDAAGKSSPKYVIANRALDGDRKADSDLCHQQRRPARPGE